MPDIILHPKTVAALQVFTEGSAHAVLLTGKTGSGKQSVAAHAAALLLGIDETAIDDHPAVTIIEANGKAISIDAVRDVQHFLSRKTSGERAINRVTLIIDADKLTPEAQNAFLKTLEEPPAGAAIIMTVSDAQQLLPTITSRAQIIDIVPPDITALRAHFQDAGYNAADIDRALLMSGGLPGLMTSILSGQGKHPLLAAAETARALLRLDTFGRLSQVDALSKQREQCLDVCFIMQQMAELSLSSPGRDPAAHRQWHTVFEQAYATQQALLAGAQPKLALTSFMLSL